jgi:hypothetical protein
LSAPGYAGVVTTLGSGVSTTALPLNLANGVVQLDSTAHVASTFVNYAQTSTWNPRTIPVKMLDFPVSPQDYVASQCGTVNIADGATHPLSGCFSTLAAAQAVYPFAVALTDELAWAATQEAVNSSTNVLVPAGTYLLNELVNVTGKYGFSFRGVNYAQINAGRGGSNFLWTGATNGQPFLWDQVQYGSIGGFTIDGNATAGIGMQVGNPGASDTSSNFHNHVDHVTIINCLGSPGYGLFVGQLTYSRDVSQSEYSQLYLSNSVVDLYQDGGQTLHNLYHDITFTHSTNPTDTQYDIYVAAGDFREDHGVFINSGSDPLAEVYVHNNAKWVVFKGDYHEEDTTDSKGYYFPTGTRFYDSHLEDIYMRWNGVSGGSAYPVYYDQQGNVSLVNVKLLPSNGTGTGQLYFNNASSTSPVVLSIQNPEWNANLFAVSANGKISYRSDGPGTVADNGFEFGSPTTGYGDLSVNNVVPRFILRESDSGTDQKNWAFTSTSNVFQFGSLNDIKTSGAAIFSVARGTGTAVSSFTLVPRTFFQAGLTDDGVSQVQVGGSMRITRGGQATELGDGLRVDRFQGSQYAVFNAYAGAARVIGVGSGVQGTATLTTSDGTTTTDRLTANSGGILVLGTIARNVGTAIASATTIAPTSSLVHITGTAAISTITAPTNISTAGQGGCISFIPDAAFTTVTGGNIALASTAIVNRVLTECYDKTAALWYPSY